MRARVVFVTSLLITLLGAIICAASAPTTQASAQQRISEAAASHELLYRLTTIAEFEALAGVPLEKKVSADGGMEAMQVSGPDGLRAMFARSREKKQPFTVLWVVINFKRLDIGADRAIELRNLQDFENISGGFAGVSNVSLARLDLRDQLTKLEPLPFDTRTIWPAAQRLPEGFDPAKVIENGKNPGLGIGALHARGIDGHGVHIAIIDQPLLTTHPEYAAQLVTYENRCDKQVPPQMHGPSVASVAVGKQCGVAPKATLSFFAVPTWQRDNHMYAAALLRIMELNEKLPAADRVRIVSLSSGMFPSQPNLDEWNDALKKAESAGIFVITCDPACLRYGRLSRTGGADPDDPKIYQHRDKWPAQAQLLVPTTRTLAGYETPDVYTYWPEGGLSWAAPYIAGVVALGQQVNPDLPPPARIKQLLVETATKTNAGPVINPEAFVDAVAKH